MEKTTHLNPTCFSQILGNEEIKKQLDYMLTKRAIGHALLFAGPEGIGKSLFAWALAARLMREYDTNPSHQHKIQLGQHPDVHIYRPEGKLGLHSIQSLRQLGEEVYLPPYEASWKVFIIHDAERMLSYSANALLKTFEEPPPRTLIILLSRSQAALLPTIFSRCRTLHFQPLSSNLIEETLQQRYALDSQVCAKLANQAQGSLGKALRLAEQGGETTRTYLLQLLAQGPLGNYRLLQEAVNKLAERLETVKKQVEASAQEELYKMPMDQLSVPQQHAIEKELEGLVSLALTQEAQAVFEYVLSWYRDAELLLVGGKAQQLTNSDFYPELEQVIQRGEFKPLHTVYKAVEEANLALQRSTSFSLCLENLLLKLGCVS